MVRVFGIPDIYRYLEIFVAKNASEALHKLHRGTRRIDLVLSDVHLPEMDGVQLIQEIKKISEDISIFSKLFLFFFVLNVKVMSSTEDLDMVYQCLKAGADHYILKPLKEELLKNLTQIVYRKRHEVIRWKVNLPNSIKAEALSQLYSEKSKSIKLEEKTAKLETEIADLKKAIDEAVETPIRIISKEVESLLSQKNLPSEVILSTILKQLKEVDIYQPAFKRLLHSTG